MDRRYPQPLIGPLCSCGALMNGVHSPGCPNRPTSSQSSLKSRRKAQESGWVRAEVLLSPALNAKLDRLAELHGSRNEAIRAAIAAL